MTVLHGGQKRGRKEWGGRSQIRTLRPEASYEQASGEQSCQPNTRGCADILGLNKLEWRGIISNVNSTSTLRSTLSTTYRSTAPTPASTGRSINGTSLGEVKSVAKEVHVCVPLKCHSHLQPETICHTKGDTTM
ncbi:hypothetical protein SK128_012516 [Halocaridina rubra]|uniref:Uncharacterized protein n=1 Tax=Halocaridina rubra TaxID=373956 RepID=A0AAN8XR04_HALRR